LAESESNEARERAERANASRLPPPKVLAIAGAVVVALLAIVFLVGRRSPEPKPVKPPPAATLRVEGRRVIADVFGLELTVPAAWTPLELPKQPGLDAAYNHPGGAVLLLYGLPVDPKDTVDGTLEMMLDQRRQQFDRVEDISWGNERFGALDMRTLAFTVNAPPAPARTRLWLAKKGRFLLGFNCSSPVSAFAEGERQCQAVLRKMSPTE
jgi:hypothetical protein